MLEHFAFFDNLAFFTYMHRSSFHKGGTLFYCCLAKRLFFFFFFIVPNQSCCVTKSNIPVGQSKSWKSYMAWCVAGHKAPFHGFGWLHYQPCRDHSPDKMVLKALRVSGFVLSAEGIILECSSP